MLQPSSSTLDPIAPVLSSTNFDLPSLHLLRSEIDVALKDAETHLSEFNDDHTQAPLLLDSIEVLGQLAHVLDLISLEGGSDLAEALAACLNQLYESGDNLDSERILDISEAIMTLDRYIEFVLLKETLEPTLLLPIINKLYAHIGKAALDIHTFLGRTSSSISIANPEANYQSPASLGLDVSKLSTAYRAGLAVVLTNQDGQLTATDRQKLLAMSAACHVIASRSKALFWQAAAAVVTDIADELPLSQNCKRTLIFLEQQFYEYLPVSDNRFADLVSFACQRNHDLAATIQKQYASNRLDDSQLDQMRRFLFGPNREVTDTLNDLIQDHISAIKEKVDHLVRQDATAPTSTDTQQIAQDLISLSQVMQLLDLQDASLALRGAGQLVAAWQSPTPQDFDQLLESMLVAENSAIFMTKAHTPGVVNLPLNNRKISLHQLDTAHDALIQESRANITQIEQVMNEYLAESQLDHLIDHDLPLLMQQIAGAIRFLQLPDAANMLSRLASFTQAQLHKGATIDDGTLAKIADVIMAVDYQLIGFEKNHPVGKQALSIGQSSLSDLLAA